MYAKKESLLLPNMQTIAINDYLREKVLVYLIVKNLPAADGINLTEARTRFMRASQDMLFSVVPY